MKIAGVVVLYNPDEKINSNIDSYINHLDRLYIVDNSDVNNKSLFNNKKIEYIFNGENLGIAKSLNVGAEKAYKEKYDWLLTMDQDSYFEKDNLDKLISFTSKVDYNSVGIVSPWHLTKENKEISKNEYDEVIDVMTSGNLVNLSLWKKIGGWKDYFFIDNVDIEYCMNLNSNNYKVISYNKSLLRHSLGNITMHKLFKKTVYSSNHNYIRQYYMIRNLMYLKDLYYDKYKDQIDHMIRGAKGRFKNILVFEKDKYRKIRNMQRGYRDYKKHIVGKYPYNN